VIDALTKIQAASKLYNEHKPSRLEEKHPTLRHTTMWKDHDFLDRLSVMKNCYQDILKRSSEHDSGRLLERFQKTFDSPVALKSICKERVSPKKTGAVYLQHGDFHFNNVLFKESEDGKTSVMLVDWQMTYMGRSTGDVSYLILSSIRPELRHNHGEKLKEAYYSSLNRYLKTYETCVIKHKVEIDVSDLERDYRESSPMSLFLSCGNVLSIESDRAATPEMSEDESEVEFAYKLCKEAASMHII